MKRMISVFMICTIWLEILFHGLAPVYAEENGRKVICGFEQVCYSYESMDKPELQMLIECLPQAVKVVFQDGTTGRVDVEWQCLDDYEQTEYDLYIFEMQPDSQYALSETLSLWDIPYAEVRILQNSNAESRICYSANTGSSKKYDAYLGATGDIVSWLESHEDDDYYLGTPYYESLSAPSKSLRPRGEYSTNVGMNCTGFVGAVMKKMGGDLSKITTRLIGSYANASNWNDTVDWNDIQSYRYTSISAMLAGGKLEKGDIIYFEPDWDIPGVDCHMGFFWGDSSNDNKFWHSNMDGNIISEIKSVSQYEYVYIFKTQKRGSLKITVSSGKTSVTKENEYYDLKGTAYTLYNSSGKMVKTLTVNASGTATVKDLPVGTYTLKQSEVGTGYVKDTATYTVKITNGNTTSRSLKLTPKTGTIEIQISSSDESVTNADTQYSLSGAVYKVFSTSGEVLETVKTNEDGYAKTTVSLAFGKYCIRQTTAAGGYNLDDTTYIVTLNHASQKKKVNYALKPHVHSIVTDVKIEASCERIGYSRGSHCKSCGSVIEEQSIIPALGHTKVYTDNLDGTHTISCSKCGKSVLTGHIYEENICRCGAVRDCAHLWKAVETDEGKNGYQCTVCDETYCDNIEEMIPSEEEICIHHAAITVSAVSASCVDEGYTEGSYCALCGETLVEQQVISPVSHVYETVYTADRKATRLSSGSKSCHCEHCGIPGKAVTIPKIASIELSKVRYSYNGSAKKPTVTVKDSKGNVLKNNTDYTLTYSEGRTQVGKYYVKVTFKGNYAGIQSKQFRIQPAAPAAFTASLYGYDDVKLTWSKSTGATSYTIYYKKSSSSSYTKLANTTATSLKKADLTDSCSYTFKIVPCYGDKVQSLYTKTVKITTQKPLAKPALVSVKNYKDYVQFTWKKVSGVTGYYVYRKTGSGEWTKTGTVKGADNVIYKDTTAVSGRKYTYTVRAYIGSDSSSRDTKGLTLIRLARPDIQIGKTTTYSVRLTWNEVKGAKGYYLYRKNDSGWKRIATISNGSTLSYTDKYLAPNTQFTYAIKSFNGSYSSSRSTQGVTGRTKAAVYTSYQTTARVNYRTGPGYTYSIVGTLSKGKTIQVEKDFSVKKEGETWYRIRRNGNTYYVVSGYLKKVSG